MDVKIEELFTKLRMFFFFDKKVENVVWRLSLIYTILTTSVVNKIVTSEIMRLPYQFNDDILS